MQDELCKIKQAMDALITDVQRAAAWDEMRNELELCREAIDRVGPRGHTPAVALARIRAAREYAEWRGLI